MGQKSGPSGQQIARAKGIYQQWQDLALRNLQDLGGAPNKAIQEGGRKMFDIQDIMDPMMQEAITTGYENAQERGAGALYGAINARLGRDVDLSFMKTKGMPASVDVRKLQTVRPSTDTEIKTGKITPYSIDDWGNLRTPDYVSWEESIQAQMIPGNPHATWAGYQEVRAHSGVDKANAYILKGNEKFRVRVLELQKKRKMSEEEAIAHINKHNR